jgi:hypothetical protein
MQVVYLFKQNLWTNSILLVSEQQKNNNIYQLCVLIQSDSTINLTHLQKSNVLKGHTLRKQFINPLPVNVENMASS